MKYATMITTIFIIYVLLFILSMFMLTLTGHSGQFYRALSFGLRYRAFSFG